MSEEEIQEVLKIIREPITVNSIEYKYFTQENYEKLLRVYENCQQFIDFYERFEQHLKILEKENQQLKKQKDDVVEYIKKNKKTVTKEMTKDTRLQVGTFMWNVDDLLRMLGEIDE